MNILIISYFFPPHNRIGSIRVGKMAKYLHQFGHEIKVITPNHTDEDISAPIEIPEENIIKTEIITFDQVLPDTYQSYSFFKKIISRGRAAVKFRKPVFFLPSASWGWYDFAIKASGQLFSEWKPDVIYSSALPITCHFAASKISRKHKIAWVAEYRDLWSGGHGARVNSVSSFFLKKIEKWLLEPADALVTVSAPLANYLQNLHKKKTEVVFNGYDEQPESANYEEINKKEQPVTIVYTGSIYEGRDPRILFEALKLLKPAKDDVIIQFYTKPNKKLKAMIEEYGLNSFVKIMERVSYDDSLRIQARADVLLFLSYSSTTHKGKGILSGKVFEYAGAQRPILSVGLDDDHLFVRQNLMVHFDDSVNLCGKLKEWIDEKKKKGFIAFKTDKNILKTYSRESQAKKLDNLLHEIIDK